MRDTIKTGMIAGLLGTLGNDLIHGPAYLILGTSTTAHYISQLIFPFKDVTLYRFTFGEIAHFAAGAFVGIILALMFKYFGSDYAYYKGIGLAIMLWLVHIAGIPNLVDPRPYLFRTDLEVLVDLIAHISYGLFSTYYLVKTYKIQTE